ncbi:hypothetical protein NIES4102_24660 [Chondrocystis sp. NIES-4102]|nr:hypothetical protein NIES4102_24660 [Chondrocystis sp. NIES-4102]
MTINNTQNKQHFCIYDYYLDGVFLKWEEAEGECPIMNIGQDWVVNMDDGSTITGKIAEMEFVSENERRILLTSI